MNYSHLTSVKGSRRRRKPLGARAIETLIGVLIVAAYWALFFYSLYQWSVS